MSRFKKSKEILIL